MSKPSFSQLDTTQDLRLSSQASSGVGQVARNIRDQCSLVPVGPSTRMFKPLKNKASTKGTPDLRLATRRTEEKFTAALVLSA